MRFDENGDGIHLSVDEVRALCEFASDDVSRERLTVVCFDPQHKRAMATDGASAIWAQCLLPGCVEPPLRFEAAATAPLNIQAEALLSATKLPGVKKHGVRIEPVDTTCAVLRVDKLTIGTDLSDKGFPPVDSVLPDLYQETPGEIVRFDVGLLTRLALVRKACPSLKANAVRVQLGTEENPARFDIIDVVNEMRWTVLLMPHRR